MTYTYVYTHKYWYVIHICMRYRCAREIYMSSQGCALCVYIFGHPTKRII